jgi:hypothetical protein
MSVVGAFDPTRPVTGVSLTLADVIVMKPLVAALG